jgi:Leucine-rich repeat (LRR) protein
METLQSSLKTFKKIKNKLQKMFQTTTDLENLSSKTLTVSIKSKTGINQANILKQLDSHNQEIINYLVIQSEECSHLVPPVFNALKFNSLVSLKIECSLKEIAGELFVELVNLKYLDLSKNQIESINQKAFKEMRKLKVLNLGNNKLALLQVGTFTDLNHLSFLDLSFNQFTNIDPKLFEYMFQLKELNLNGNQFQTFNPKMLHFIKGN